MKISAFAAVDPGVSGGVAVLNDNGDLETSAMPKTHNEIFDMLLNIREAGIRKIALENIVLFTGQNRPGARMIVYGVNFGFLQGVIVALGFTLTLVTPQQWQRALNLSNTGVPRNKWKAHLATVAREKFPKAKITLQTADAALIAAAMKTGTPKTLSVPGTLRCGVCFRLCPPDKFYVKRSSYLCKECSNAKSSRTPWLKYNYGLTEEEFEALSQKQSRQCAICRQVPNERLAVDHDHLTDEVRGLLCRKCNCGLGFFSDSRSLLRAAIDYLHPQRENIEAQKKLE
jgi:hypothetical protein